MMFRKQHPIIRDTEELSKKLHPTFVLLVGSAVSGASIPKLPMVPDVLSGIVCRAKATLDNDDYRDRTLAEYASSLISGRYSTILNTTKFEEFLWHIDKVMGRRDARDDLLESLYVCEEGEFGPNHRAITTLLNSGNCTACLTTNFDNALERSDPDLDVHCHQIPPGNLPDLNDPPILLKLHGDAGSRNCVATSPELYQGGQLEEHEYLRALLAHRTVLVVGYSGFGDVDISPHLEYAARKCGTEFIWGVRNGKHRVPDFAKCKAVLDLGSNDPGKNLLLGLAARHGWQNNTSGNVRKWQEHLKDWCTHCGHDTLRRLLLSILEGQIGWHTLHIFHCSNDARDSSLWPLVHGRGCLKVAAYVSAEKSIEKALSSMESWTREKVEALMFLGFARWRHGYLDDAIRTLQALVDLEIDSFSEEAHPTIAKGCRIYLEVCRDWMQYKRHVRDRRCFYDEHTLGKVIDRLEDLPTRVDVGDRILTDIVIADVRRLIDEKVELSEVQKSYDESFNYMYWEIAEAAARVMVNISFRRGLVALLKVDYEHAKLGHWNKIRKSSAAILHALLGGRFPIILSSLDGPMLASWKTPLIEWRYKGKRRKWENQRLHDKIKIV